MRSSLKKSLYLGLAALSFASVAGAAFENTTASAKKTTKAKKTAKKAAKKAYPKVTSLVNISNQDSQPVGYTISSGTLTNKPDGVKGSHSVATGISSSTIFMRYQTATVSNGKTYYKVVSFDKKYRGFVSADQIQPTDTYTNQSLDNTPAVYLKYPGNQNIYSSPKGATFKNQYALRASDTGKLATSAFGVNGKATVKSTGDVVYHLVNLANPSIQGWVSASAVTTTPSRYFDQGADLKVNFVNDAGTTVASQIVNVTNNPNVAFNNLSTDRVLTSNFVSSIFNLDSNNNFTIQDGAGSPQSLTSSLNGIGYAVTSADLAYTKQQLATKDVKVGDSINIHVTSNVDQNQAVSTLKFKSINPVISGSGNNVSVQWNPADAKDISSSEVAFPQLNDAGQAAFNNDFKGNKNAFVGSKNGQGLNAIFTANDSLFGTNGPLSYFVGTTNTSITSTSQYTNGYVNQSDSKANNNNDGQTTNAFNNQTSGMLAFASDNDAKAAAAKTTDTKSLASIISDNQNSMAKLKIGQQFHFVYVIDRQATKQYNAWATLYGQPVTVVYDAVPVATAASTSTTTSGFSGYIYNK